MIGWLAMSEQAFLNHLQPHFEKVLAKDCLKTWRELAWRQLSAIGFPSKSHESFRYVTLRELYQSSFCVDDKQTVDFSLFSDAILPECAHSYIVFVNGNYSAHLSDLSALENQLVILSLDVAMRHHGSFLQSYFQKLMKEEMDPFAHLNLSLHESGLFLYLPPRNQIKIPLQFIHVITAKEPQIIAPRLHLSLGANSHLRCIFTEHILHPSTSHFHVPATEIYIEEDANFNLLSVQENTALWQMQTLRATLKRGAKLNALSFQLGSKAARQSYKVSLKEEGSSAHLSGLWMLNHNHSAHTHTLIEHLAEHTSSLQKFKGVLSDNSRSSFDGKILVQKQAQKTEAYQLNKNLILSPGAIANSKPNLEIFADDVKASHGSTVSQLDEEQLFYLNARGIDLQEAKSLLIHGFCREMIEKIEYDSILKSILRYCERI